MSIEIQATGSKASIDSQLHTDPAKVAQNKAREVAAAEAQKVEVKETQKVSQEVVDEKEITEISREKIEEAVGKLQDYANQYKRELKFSIDAESGKTIVRLLDSEDKLLRQIPSEDVLSLAKSLQERSAGLFEDQV